MKKLVLLLISVILVLCVSSCKKVEDKEIENYVINTNGITFTASADRYSINIDITSEGNSGDIDIYATGAYAYLDGDETPRVGGETDNFSLKLETVTCNGSCSVSVKRFNEDGSDNYYKKFYVVKDGEILAGPFWVTSINPKYSPAVFTTKTKKGACASLRNLVNAAIVDLDVNYIFCGIGLGGQIAPNEIVSADGKETSCVEQNKQRADAGELTAFDYNGTTYYFVEDEFKRLDTIYQLCTKNKVQVIGQVLVPNTTNQNAVPYYLYPHAAEGSKAAFVMPDTSNEKGAGYWGAYMSFIAQRYSDSKHGLVQYFILGNEVDYPREWNAIVKDNKSVPSVSKYTEEYYRALRIAALALAEASSNQQMLTCYTYWWDGNDVYNSNNGYHPYDITQLLMSKTNTQGNFKWGFASHGYGYNLLSAPIKTDTSQKYVDTIKGSSPKRISINNIEVLDSYLKKTEHLDPGGKIRPVLITEVGLNSSDADESGDYDQILGNLAYCYYKAEMTDCVQAWTYFSMRDSGTTKPTFGLQTANGMNKPTYGMWKVVDKTDPSEFEKYIPSIQYTPKGKSKATKFASGTTFLDVFKTVSSITGTSVNWDAKWNSLKTKLAAK